MENENTSLQTREKEELQGEATRPGPVFRPDVDILEKPDGFLVYADVPGANDRSVSVRIDRGELTLDAQLVNEPGQGWSPIHAEYRLGSYHRKFRISDDIDPDGVSAKVANGVLELRLPKSKERQPRTIPVHGA